MGTFLFYLLWPFVWFYAPLFVRGRGIIMVDGKVLVVKNWFGPGVWQLPGGGVKFGEQPIDAINRELQEELALTLQGELINHEAITIQSRGLLLRQFYAVYKLDKEPAVSMSREVTATAWLTLDEAPIPVQIRKKLN